MKYIPIFVIGLFLGIIASKIMITVQLQRIKPVYIRTMGEGSFFEFEDTIIPKGKDSVEAHKQWQREVEKSVHEDNEEKSENFHIL